MAFQRGSPPPDSGRHRWRLAQAASLARLLREAGAAHHEAFAATHGADAHWPAWYAEWLVPRLREQGLEAGAAELADALARFDAEHREMSVPDAWDAYYARRLIERFA